MSTLSEYKVLQGQNIFDLINGFYGNFDEAYTFIQANPQIENINYDFDSNPNTIVNYDASFISNTPSEIPTQQTEAASTTSTIKALDVQNIFDICASSYGSFDLMYKLIQDNDIDSINAGLIAQKVFTFDNSLVHDDILFNHIISNNITIATGLFIESPALLQENGFYLLQENGFKILL